MQEMEEIFGSKSGLVLPGVGPPGRYGKRENFCHFAILPFGRVPPYDCDSLALSALGAPKSFSIFTFGFRILFFPFWGRAALPHMCFGLAVVALPLLILILFLFLIIIRREKTSCCCCCYYYERFVVMVHGRALLSSMVKL